MVFAMRSFFLDETRRRTLLFSSCLIRGNLSIDAFLQVRHPDFPFFADFKTGELAAFAPIAHG